MFQRLLFSNTPDLCALNYFVYLKERVYYFIL